MKFRNEGEFVVDWPANVVYFELTSLQGDADLFVHRDTVAPDRGTDVRPALGLNDCDSRRARTSEEVCTFYQQNAMGTYQYLIHGWTRANNQVDRAELAVLTNGNPPNVLTDPITKTLTPGPTPTPVCGDGKVQGSELCDGKDFGSLTCASYQFPTSLDGSSLRGDLTCDSSCSIDSAHTGCLKSLLRLINFSITNGQSHSETVTANFGGMTVLRFETRGGSHGSIGDVDLYVKQGSAPTLTDYDCKSTGRGNNEACTFHESGTYHILLYAAGNIDVAGLDVLVLTDGTPPAGTPTLAPVTPPTPTPEPTMARVCGDGILQPDVGEVCDTKSFATTCENQGYLFGGQLQCASDCLSFDTFNCLKVLHQVSFQWATAGTSITGSYPLDHAADVVEVRIIGGLGDADLYVQWGNTPLTLTTYDCMSDSASNFETCTFYKPPVGETVYFMMYAYATFKGASLVVLGDGDAPTPAPTISPTSLPTIEATTPRPTDSPTKSNNGKDDGKNKIRRNLRATAYRRGSAPLSAPVSAPGRLALKGQTLNQQSR